MRPDRRPWAAAAALALLAGAANAQPVEVDIGAALSDAALAYRAGPIAERITVAVRRIAGGLAADLASPPAADADPLAPNPVAGALPVLRDRAERRADIVLRLWPAGKSHGADAAIALELGELRAVLAGGEATAVSARNDRAYFRAPYDPPLGVDDLARMFPPLPLPQLDLALPASGGPVIPNSLTPYASRIIWESAMVDDLQLPTRLLLRGRTAHGAVALTTDPETGRLIEFACDIAAPAPDGLQPVLVVRAQPLPAPGPKVASIDTEGRDRVDAISGLALRPAPELTGRLVTGLPILTPDGGPWSLADGFRAAPGGRPPERLALLLIRDEPPAARAAAAALQRLDERAARDSTWGVRWWAVVVADGAADAAQAGLTAAPDRLGIRPDRVLWSRSAGDTIDRYAPGVAAAVIVIGQDRRLVGVVPLDGRMAASETSAEVERLLWPQSANENGPASDAGPE